MIGTLLNCCSVAGSISGCMYPSLLELNSLHISWVYIPNLVVIVIAVLITLLLFVSCFLVGGSSAFFWELFKILIGPTHIGSARLFHRVKNKFKTYVSIFVSIIGFIASVTGIAGWLGFALHLGDAYVPNPIIIIVAIFIAVLLSIGFFRFGILVADSLLDMPLQFNVLIGVFTGPSVREVAQWIAEIKNKVKRTIEERQLITEIERMGAEEQQDQQ
jgi:hypothetical protein